MCYFQDIGGNDIQKQEIKEAVELPLTHHELYRQIGIDPPRGVLLYGPPGTGKTMLAKAVAHHTTAAFIRVVGSEFVQKYLGEVRQPLLFATSRDTVRQLCESYLYNCCSSHIILMACVFGCPQVCPIRVLVFAQVIRGCAVKHVLSNVQCLCLYSNTV